MTTSMRAGRTTRRVLRNPLTIAGLAVLVVAVLAAVFAPVLAPYAFERTDFSQILAPPGSAGHLLGTDDLGRDLLSRVLYGLRASLQVGVLSVLLALVAGVPLGMLAGYFRALDGLVSRLTDLVLAFPFLVLAVGLAAIRGPSLENAALALGIGQLPFMIRVARSETLRIKALDYVAASIAEGARDSWILIRHVLPNSLSALTVQATVTLPIAVIGESILSFLGLGVRPPTPSLGTMLSEAQSYSATAPWTAVIPGLAIISVALAFNIFGDGLRDAFDPRGGVSG